MPAGGEMSRGKFEYQWRPFVDAPKHTISNDDLVCLTEQGAQHLCTFENERFIDVDGETIENVVLYQNNPALANSMRAVIDYMARLGKK
jgi:hypothetical protein